MEHFPAVCCFGGEPFLDFHTNSSIDPTDWLADLVKDPTNSVDQDLVISNLTESFAKIGINVMSQCQIFNITFNDLADQTLFDTYKARFLCRCPIGFSGQSCEIQPIAPTLPPISLPLVSKHPLISPPDPMVMLIVVAAVVFALMAVLAMLYQHFLSFF
ncbi:hypothetical protein B9Z55_007963 [Caenorhabditis nigoni]|uniref:EGF-like domain-containing protein n=1 Tax=Caenorhabditis nigoni TaxID=1611254 RepID=A0A2G5VC37_9PELO|nr:hypothetical protein B9Z55_007963 [Caenorhabditis nigoni]